MVISQVSDRLGPDEPHWALSRSNPVHGSKLPGCLARGMEPGIEQASVGNNQKGDSYFAAGGWRVSEVQASQSPRRLLRCARTQTELKQREGRQRPDAETDNTGVRERWV